MHRPGIFWDYYIFGPKFFGPRFLDPKFLEGKKLFGPKNLFNTQFLLDLNLFYPKFFWMKSLLDQQVFY